MFSVNNFCDSKDDINFMLKFITNNWAAKLICLILAIFLWSYVAIGESKVDNFPGKIPIQLKNVPSNLVPILDTDQVQIKISADNSLWNRLSSESFEASIDLGGAEEGTKEYSVNVSSNVSGVDVIEVSPKKVLVRIEKIVDKKIPVKLQTKGQAGEGLVPGDAVIDPNEITISGAKEIVDKTLEATAVMVLNGETNQIEKKVKLVALDSQGNEISNVGFDPEEVKVTLPIVKAGTTKTVGIKAKLDGNPQDGFWISQVDVSPADITISGNSGVLRGINYIETKTIDVTGLKENLSKSIDLDLPSGISLVGDIKQVKIDIKLSADTTEKEIIPGISYDNLLPSFKVDSVDPTTIKILASGVASVLSTLNSNNTLVHLDLSIYHAPGNYSIDITRDMITAPNGVSVSSYVPSAVRVTISNK